MKAKALVKQRNSVKVQTPNHNIWFPLSLRQDFFRQKYFLQSIENISDQIIMLMETDARPGIINYYEPSTWCEKYFIRFNVIIIAGWWKILLAMAMVHLVSLSVNIESNCSGAKYEGAHLIRFQVTKMHFLGRLKSLCGLQRKSFKLL